MHSQKAFDVSGGWFRWSQYQLRDGILMPDLASLSEYDPWEKYRANVGKYRTVAQPYVALLELQRALDDAEERGIRPFHSESFRFGSSAVVGPKNEADELILEWSTQYGLLGLLNTLCNSICLPAELRHFKEREMWMVKQTIHVRDGGVWTPIDDLREVLVPGTSKTSERAARRELARQPKPAVSWLNPESKVYEQRPLDTIKDFFPFESQRKPGGRLLPPCPNYGGFWADYGEPVPQFLFWCRLFARAVNHLSRWAGGAAVSEAQWDVVAVDRSFRTLSALAQSAGPSFRFNRTRGSIEEARGSAGLLASYALMFLWDFMDGRRALRCENCRRHFVTNEKRAKYCKISCRNTAQSRRTRSRQKALVLQG
jgi:hypothetical protein